MCWSGVWRMGESNSTSSCTAFSSSRVSYPRVHTRFSFFLSFSDRTIVWGLNTDLHFSRFFFFFLQSFPFLTVLCVPSISTQSWTCNWPSPSMLRYWRCFAFTSFAQSPSVFPWLVRLLEGNHRIVSKRESVCFFVLCSVCMYLWICLGVYVFVLLSIYLYISIYLFSILISNYLHISISSFHIYIFRMHMPSGRQAQEDHRWPHRPRPPGSGNRQQPRHSIDHNQRGKN